eukprot:3832002-Prymnesium_polylepis.1
MESRATETGRAAPVRSSKCPRVSPWWQARSTGWKAASSRCEAAAGRHTTRTTAPERPAPPSCRPRSLWPPPPPSRCWRGLSGAALAWSIRRRDDI